MSLYFKHLHSDNNNCAPSFLRSLCEIGGDCFGPRYFSEGVELPKKNTEVQNNYQRIYTINDRNKDGAKLLLSLKVDMPILTCIFFTFNWLTLTSEMHFVKSHPEVASYLLSRGKRKYASLGMRLLWKYIRNYFLVYQLISHFLLYLQNCKEFEAEILDLQSEKYGLSFDIKKYTTSG